MTRRSDSPSISLVVTSRNDNHGGDLLRRMQIFVTGWLEQARRYRVNSELIIVEWNPPSDRPPLAEALVWPRDPGPCAVRIIQVPPHIHRRYRHSDKMALFQYIAKNVGIRRARGRFVLATNIDLLFSDSLARFLASPPLNLDYMYRIDRHDVPADVPLHAPVTEQLQYCRDNVMRVNTREGTYTPEELRSALSRFLHRNKFMRNLAKLRPLFPYRPRSLRSLVDRKAHRRAIAARVELLSTALRFVGRVLFRSRVVQMMAKLPGHLAAAPRRPLRVATAARHRGGAVLQQGLRVVGRLLAGVLLLPVRLAAEIRKLLPYWPRTLGSLRDPVAIRRFFSGRVEVIGAWFRALGRVWTRSARGVRRWARVVGRMPQRVPSVRSMVRLIREIRKLLPYRPRRLKSLTDPGALGRFRDRAVLIGAWLRALRPGATLRTRQGWLFQFRGIKPLHTNACGDFTMLSRERWSQLRGYPELEIFSIHLDSVLCNMARYAGSREVVLRGSDMRLYHIEHASGWSPDEVPRLIQRLNDRGIPWIDMPEFDDWVACMRATQQPLIFNDGNWGLASEKLDETIIRYGEPAGLHERRHAIG